MKNINILSLTQAFDSLDKPDFERFLKYHCIPINIAELKDLKVLVENLIEEKNDISLLNTFYIGFQIPQIGKEFDLLRLGENCVINVELKSSSTPAKILKQLNRNKYYLSFIGKEVHSFTFVSETAELYRLKEHSVKVVDISELLAVLENQVESCCGDLNSLFNPSDYLVSPFNSTEKFVSKEYFLTHQQEDIKAQVLKAFENKLSPCFVSITGNAGTGKTLLVYDLAKEIKDNQQKVLILHCGQLNNGQKLLNAEHDWNIKPIKALRHETLLDYDVIIIDEAQRIYKKQFKTLVADIQGFNGKCIFSYDKSQTLSKKERANKIGDCISGINSVLQFNLSEKIRTNKEIAKFIKALFDKGRADLTISSTSNVSLSYFNNIDDAKAYIGAIDDQEWKVIRFTPSQYDPEYHEKYLDAQHITSHGVIGQEFDNVVVVMDNFFTYTKEGKLGYRSRVYYDPVRMLFQNLTRTRKRLNIVIIDNKEVLERCLSIFKC